MVSELMFGCGNVGGMMIRQPHEVMKQAVADALAAGMNWFDTAALYGEGKSEENLGRVLRELGADVHVSTKGSVDASSGEPYREQMARACAESLARLGRPSVDLYQLHGRIARDGAPRSVTPEQVLGPDGVLDAMERLRDHGKCMWIGVTALGDTDAIREVLASGRVDTCQVYVNMINPTATHPAERTPAPPTGQDFAGIIDAARAADVGVVAIRTLAAGVLAGATLPNARALLTKNTELADEVRKAQAVHAALGTQYGTRAQTALRYALGVPGVACIDFAIGERAHLAEGLQAVDLGPLPQPALDRLSALSRSDFR
jgi:L-galactose dehydrogenase/L-glyceraldehyde 3-phosphate reductase